ncbi:MAG: hypothetical protein GY834_10570 [Bacteroidetes bacterium]|nr:hypothetical protein [Bacteroidota bacterium]
MISSRGKALSPEIKRLIVSAKHYFDNNKLTPKEPSAKRTADAFGVGIATVKRIMADYNRNPNLLDRPKKMRGRPVHALAHRIKKLSAPTLERLITRENT